jgi:chromate transporter
MPASSEDGRAGAVAQGLDPKSDASPWRIFLRFLRFGLLAWGGPVAQIAMLRRDLVDHEHWVSSSRFNRLLAVYQVLPGPEAHEMCVHLGILRGRRLGGIAAGLGFMLPGFVLMLALSWLYLTIDLSQWTSLFLGVQVAVIALIVRAIQNIGGHVLTDVPLWAIAVGSTIASLVGVPFWLTLPVAGLTYVFAARGHVAAAVGIAGAAVAVYGIGVSGAVFGGSGVVPHLPPLEPSPIGLFLSGLKAGLLTFGGAYTVIPFLRGDAVGGGWLTDARFLDGLVLSGILPAPLIIFATFVGYASGGPVGAITMTGGIFLPAFAFSLLLFDRLESVLDNERLRRLLEGVAAGVVGLIAATTLDIAVELGKRLPSLLSGVLIFTASLVVLVSLKGRMSTPVAIIVGGVCGWLLFGWLGH